MLSLPLTGRAGDASRQVYNSITSIDGLTVVTLSGPPFDIGHGHGVLLGERFPETEEAFNKIMPPIPLGWFGEMLLHWYVMGKVEDIEGYLTSYELEELRAVDDAIGDPDHDYRDLLYYHVLQDIGQYYACTGGAVCGERSAAGGALAGRNFDLNRDGALDALETVYYIRPDYGAAYVSVAWPGMVGAVSGMNEHGLAVMEFSAKGEGAELEGVPVAFVMKRVLMNARNIDEAVEVVEGVNRMGPNIFLMADRERAVVIEFDSEVVLVRDAPDNTITVANHFLATPLSVDEKNVEYMEESDTVQRYDRMYKLIYGDGPVDVADMAAMLRDHKGTDGKELAPDDPSAINNTKCAHSVMFDTGSLTVWVSKGPMAYGEYVGFRMADIGLIQVDTVPAAEYIRPEAATER